MQVEAESFHLNGHIIRFRPQTQKLESPYKTPSSTPAVKGLMLCLQKSPNIINYNCSLTKYVWYPLSLFGMLSCVCVKALIYDLAQNSPKTAISS